MVDHIDHICQLAGNARHCGIGTDLDGAFGREQTPADLDTIADLSAVCRTSRLPRIQAGGCGTYPAREFPSISAKRLELARIFHAPHESTIFLWRRLVRAPLKLLYECGALTRRRQRMKSTRWIVVLLLLLSVAINYVDRGSLSVAAPLLSKEFNLLPDQMGVLLSGFFWSYAVFQLVSGWLVDRYDVKWVYAAGFCVWSLAMAGTGMVGSFAGLVAARVLLGIGESVGYPAISQIVVRHVRAARARAAQRAHRRRHQDRSRPEHHDRRARGHSIRLARAVYCDGSRGVDLADSVAVADAGAAGTSEPEQKRTGPTLPEMLCRREVWGTSLAMFSLGYVWYFLLDLAPVVPGQRTAFFHGTNGDHGIASVLGDGAWRPWPAAGLPTDGSRGAHSPTRARRTMVLAGLAACGVLILPVGYVADAGLALGLLMAACAGLGLFTSNVWAITQTLAGPEAAGQWSGFQNFIGNLGGVVSPLLAGVIVKQTGRSGSRSERRHSSSLPASSVTCCW